MILTSASEPHEPQECNMLLVFRHQPLLFCPYTIHMHKLLLLKLLTTVLTTVPLIARLTLPTTLSSTSPTNLPTNSPTTHLAKLTIPGSDSLLPPENIWNILMMFNRAVLQSCFHNYVSFIWFSNEIRNPEALPKVWIYDAYMFVCIDTFDARMDEDWDPSEGGGLRNLTCVPY